MIPRSLPLFVTPVMLFIDHDQTEIVQRGKKGRTSTDHHLRPALAYLMPGFSPLRHSLTAMQNA
jgi:hypothetical protein